MQRMRTVALSLGFAALVGASQAREPAQLAEQRAAFIEAHAAAERGDWKPAEDAGALLESYVLWPDLRATYLRTQLPDAEAAVKRFLERHGDLKPARELRYRYALSLARAQRHADYLELYDRHYADLDQANLDCLAADALLSSGRARNGRRLAVELWLVGRSQVEECDAAFERMRTSGHLTNELYRQRYELAVDARDFGLARYLAKSLDAEAVEHVASWRRAQSEPEEFLQAANTADHSALHLQQLGYAAERLAYREPLEALSHWRRLVRKLPFTDDVDHAVRRHAALWAARQQRPEASDLLAALPAAAVTTEVLRWRARVALHRRDWTRLATAIAELPNDERQREQWRYWRGIAYEGASRPAEAKRILAELAGERSYYGFLAADQLGLDYAFQPASLASERATQQRLASRPDIVRARELFHVGLESRARSEWDAAVRGLAETEKTQAALLAHGWNWHSRAIAAAAQSGEYDDLDVRYPLPHRHAFRRWTSAAGIRESWAYGIARSESLFMRDVRSSAGAIGVMQLMPRTGRETARKINQPYRGYDTLTDPESNIRLGTHYLAKMQQTFDQHPALATAAYNAGPRRVTQWLTERPAGDARVWIESIPFNETRRYVRRVLAADVIFHWRLTGETLRLSQQLPPINPSQLADSA